MPALSLGPIVEQLMKSKLTFEMGRLISHLKYHNELVSLILPDFNEQINRS
jgi:hypothetical protein